MLVSATPDAGPSGVDIETLFETFLGQMSLNGSKWQRNERRADMPPERGCIPWRGVGTGLARKGDETNSSERRKRVEKIIAISKAREQGRRGERCCRLGNRKGACAA